MTTSHSDSDVVSDVISDTETEYRKVAYMTITRGKIHKYVGITTNYSSLGEVKFYMVD